MEQRYDDVARKAEVVEGLHSTEYGMREFIVKDLNGFWITFGQPLQSRQVTCARYPALSA